MDGFDAKGRPQRVPGQGADAGRHADPAARARRDQLGAAVVQPADRLFYVAHWENTGTIVVEGEFPRAVGINPRQTTMGQTNLQQFYNNDDEAYGVVRAYDPNTLEPKWEYKMNDITWGGVLTTAGDVAVQRRQGRLFLRARRADGRAALEGIRRRPGQQRPDELLRRRQAVRDDRRGQRAVRVRAARRRNDDEHRSAHDESLGFVSFVIFAIFVVVVRAQAPAYKVPRTPDGQPDLQGFWSNSTYTPLERPDNVTKEFYTPAEAVAAEKAAAARERAETSPAPSPTCTTTSLSSDSIAARRRSRELCARR